MSSDSKDEDIVQERTSDEINNERALSYARNVPPIFVNSLILMGTSDEIRLVVGQKISEEFLPSGHVVMTVGTLQALLSAGAEHLKKVATGRAVAGMGPMAGSA